MPEHEADQERRGRNQEPCEDDDVVQDGRPQASEVDVRLSAHAVITGEIEDQEILFSAWPCYP